MKRLSRAVFSAVALTLACASRQPDPPAQIVWTHAPPHADADASIAAIADATPVATAAEPAHSPRPITPILPALRVENLRFREVSECARGVCRIEGRSPFAPTEIAADDGATTLPPAMAWVEVIRPGASVSFTRRGEFDVLGVVLVGEVALDRVDGPRTASPSARPWTAFLSHAGGVTLRTLGREPSAVLLVTAAGETGETDAPGSLDLVTRDLSTTEDLAWAGGAMHARIAFEGPASRRASLGVLIASDDAPVAEHDHATSWEVLSALSASGRLHLPAQTVGERALPERDRTVTDGTIAYVPSGVRHGWRPDGTHPLIAVQVYAPAGPEQRFRTLARAASAPQSEASNRPSNGAPTP